MKIAMVSEHASPLATLGGVDAGGQNVHVAALATALGDAGHDVVVYTRRDDPCLAQRVDFAPGVQVCHLDAGPPTAIAKDDLFEFMPEFARELHHCLRAQGPDVIHSHFWMSGWASLRAARWLGIPLVHTYHALGVTKRRHQGAMDTSPPMRCDAERELARACHHIIATSSEEVFELLRMDAEAPRLSVIPCGVDLAFFGARTAPPQPGRVLVVSRLVERKGIATVIEALAAVPDAHLVVAGGPARAELPSDARAVRLRAIAHRAGVAERVEFVGGVDAATVRDLYHSASVVACVPWYEPFGLVALEAMASARPVVASAVGGLVDTVIDGVTGVHVPPRDADALADALTRVLADPAHAAALGSAGRHRAQQRYEWATIARETVAAYAVARGTWVRSKVSVG
jgi:D-inositol-3-phosphate glycosyltransferase